MLESRAFAKTPMFFGNWPSQMGSEEQQDSEFPLKKPKVFQSFRFEVGQPRASKFSGYRTRNLRDLEI